MNARHIHVPRAAPPDAVARCRQAIFRALHSRAIRLSRTDGVTSAESIAASASAMIADSVMRTSEAEEIRELPRLRLVGRAGDLMD